MSRMPQVTAQELVRFFCAAKVLRMTASPEVI